MFFSDKPVSVLDVDKRLSEALSTFSTTASIDLQAEASKYVCPDCGTPDPDPYVGLLDRSIVFYCPRCRREALAEAEAEMKAGTKPTFTRYPIKGFS